MAGNITMRPEIGEVVVDPNTSRCYRREELLGQGAFANCYKMRDLDSGETFALKVIPLYSWGPFEECEELEILKKLQHPNVVGFSHYFKDKNNMYIFMEVCGGKTLHGILKARGTLTNSEVRYYMKQLISGLMYIHSQGFVHRDIKLDNLFINEDMELKIGDFGLATKKESREKAVCGTPCYTAPEVWKREGYGAEADTWALGCVMYQLLVGDAPFDENDYSQLVKQIEEVKYTLPKSLSGPARKLISKILQEDPKARPTLHKILCHKFFTKGFTPKILPPSSCDTVPEVKPVNPIRKFFKGLARRLGRQKRSRAEPPEEVKLISPVKLTWSSWSKWVSDILLERLFVLSECNDG